jgi:hypothetical protein
VEVVVLDVHDMAAAVVEVAVRAVMEEEVGAGVVVAAVAAAEVGDDMVKEVAVSVVAEHEADIEEEVVANVASADQARLWPVLGLVSYERCQDFALPTAWVQVQCASCCIQYGLSIWHPDFLVSTDIGHCGHLISS